MLSRLRKLLHSDKSKSGDQDTGKRMPFITGSQPWLKPYMLAALAHPPEPPSLNAHYLQAISPVSSRRELTVYDGRFIIPAVLSQAAASMLDADEDDTGVTTRNLLGHVLAPVSVIVVPDMTTTPPTATLLIKEIRVFADRIHQRPVGRVPFVYTDTDVCDALRAIVGRQLASYATATVLERADRATEIPGENTQETDSFFEKLLTDPSIPPSNLISDSEPFVMSARRGAVVGGGVGADDEHEPLAIIPENPTPSEGEKPKDLQDSPTRGDSQSNQSNQRDSEWEINFTQDPAEGGGIGGGDLPQTQHFAIDEDDDDDDDNDNNDNDNNNDDDDNVDDDDDDDDDDDEKTKELNMHVPRDDEVDHSTPDRGKSVGEQRIQEIVGNAQDDTLDGQDLQQAAKPGDSTTSPNPNEGNPRNQKSPVRPPKSTLKAGEESTEGVVHKGVRRPPKRKRRTEPHSSKGNPTEHTPESPETRQRSAPQGNANTNSAKVHSGPSKLSDSSSASPKRRIASHKPKKNTSTINRTKENRRISRRDETQGTPEQKAPSEDKNAEQSPAPVTRSAAKVPPVQVPEKAKDGSQTSTPKTSKDDESDTGLASTRRSPRTAEMKTPPRRPRNPPKLPGESNEEKDITGSPETPLRRSPRLLGQKSPSQGTPSHDLQSPLRRSQRRVANALNYEEESGDRDIDSAMGPARGARSAKPKPRLDGEQLLREEKLEEEGGNDSAKVQGKEAMEETTPPHMQGLTPARKREERGSKRKAPDVSSPADAGSKKRQQIEQPESDSPEPFLDKIKAEIEEMRRFRDSIDKNPDAFKAYPDGFLPSAKPARESVRRVLKFPPPVRPVSQPLDVPESAPM